MCEEMIFEYWFSTIRKLSARKKYLLRELIGSGKKIYYIEETEITGIEFLTEEEIKAVHEKCGAQTNDVIFVVASDDNSVVFASLGALRLHIAKKFQLFDPNRYNFLWVTEFPLFEWNKDENRY